MYQFNVQDMTCGHCVSRVTKAVKGADSQAQVKVSLGEKRIAVSSSLAPEEIAGAIKDAGYTPVAA